MGSNKPKKKTCFFCGNEFAGQGIYCDPACQEEMQELRKNERDAMFEEQKKQPE